MAAELFTSTYPLRGKEIETWADPTQARYVAVVGDPERIVAYSALWQFRLDGYRMDLIVAPDQRRRGIGERLLASLIDGARAAGAITLQARVEETWEQSLSFLRSRGFVETMRMHRLLLQVDRATLEPYDQIEAQLAASGIVITTLTAENAQDPLCWTKFRDVARAAGDGWPDPDPRPTPDPLESPEAFRRRYSRGEKSAEPGTAGCFLAKHEDRYVGFTGASGTGVRPEYRGRGIATALKVRAVALARALGVTTTFTSSGSPAMLHINERLGCRRTSTEIRLVKPI